MLSEFVTQLEDCGNPDLKIAVSLLCILLPGRTVEEQRVAEVFKYHFWKQRDSFRLSETDRLQFLQELQCIHELTPDHAEYLVNKLARCLHTAEDDEASASVG